MANNIKKFYLILSNFETRSLKNVFANDYFKNFYFYFFEKILRGFLSLFILKIFSKQYPQRLFGQLIYNESIVFILVAIAGLSLDKIIIRLINQKKFNQTQIIDLTKMKIFKND